MPQPIAKPTLTISALASPSAGLILLGLFLLLALPQARAQQAVDFDTQTLQMALSGEPPMLTSFRATDQVSGFVLTHLQEGLLRKDRDNQLAPGVAESWELEETRALFRLRPDARWSDGEAVTAHDFVFAWRMAVDPEVASEYATIMYYIKNGEAVNNGELPVDALGVRALDDLTLEVELEQPTAYFLSLVAFPTYYPVREDFYHAQNGRYGADAHNLLANGPFTLSEWVHGASLRMDKNPHYWDRQSVHLQSIRIPYITPDPGARFNLFKDGHLAIENAMIGLGADQLEDALRNRYRIHSHADGSLFWMEFNHRPDRVTRNKHLRKAIQAVFDTGELVDRVIGVPGYIAGASLFPTWLPGVEHSFRDEFPVPVVELSVTRAREYLALARQELGVERIPPLVIVVDDGPVASIQAQYLQNLLRRTLDLELRIDRQTFKMRLAKMLSGEFDMVLSGWGPDYEDPMTFAEVFASWNENNRGQWSNADYDRQLRIAQSSLDPQTRMAALAQAQAIVVEEAPFLPAYERVISYVQHPRLEGVILSVTGGSPNFTFARVREE